MEKRAKAPKRKRNKLTAVMEAWVAGQREWIKASRQSIKDDAARVRAARAEIKMHEREIDHYSAMQEHHKGYIKLAQLELDEVLYGEGGS